MAKSTRSASPAINSSEISPHDIELGDSKQEIVHTETRNESFTPHHKWKVSATGGGDTAMALFNSPTDVREAIDPEEERKLVRKIDWMILPYLSVCYAFFYVSVPGLIYYQHSCVSTSLTAPRSIKPHSHMQPSSTSVQI